MVQPVTLAKYVRAFKQTFPRGWAWLFPKDLAFDQLVNSMAQEFARVDEKARSLFDEFDPRTTFELLTDWERLVGIPDECTPDPNNLGSLFERRVRVLQKLTTGGGQTPAFYALIAEQLGYDADILDVKNFTAFRVGLSTVGQPLSNTGSWGYTWVVKAPAELERFFRTGINTVGERLVLRDNETLRCVISRFKPAHTIVLFQFET